jgi:hypothetical protein
LTHGYNAWGSSPRARFAQRRPLNPLNTVFSSVPSPNGLGKPSITSAKNEERPMTSLFPGDSVLFPACLRPCQIFLFWSPNVQVGKWVASARRITPFRPIRDSELKDNICNSKLLLVSKLLIIKWIPPLTDASAGLVLGCRCFLGTLTYLLLQWRREGIFAFQGDLSSCFSC